MQKAMVGLVLASALLIMSSAFAGQPDDSILSQHLKEADGTSGQNTNAGSGVKTGHIQDGAVTSLKIADGAITDSKISGPYPEQRLRSTQASQLLQ